MESFDRVAPVSLPYFQLLNCAETASEIKPAPIPFSTFQRGICPRVQLLSQLQGWLCCGCKLARGLGEGNGCFMIGNPCSSEQREW